MTVTVLSSRQTGHFGTYAFLPCALSASGMIRGEFLRPLYILAHRRTHCHFASLGDDEPCTEVFHYLATVSASGNITPPSALRPVLLSPASLACRDPLASASGLSPTRASFYLRIPDPLRS